jgi:two-component system sensor histidine kinase CpxA
MRLFFRIYRAFLMATVAAFAASVFVSTGVRRDSLLARWTTIADGPLAVAAQTAADRYEDNGKNSAQTYLISFSRAVRLDLAFFDGSGNLLFAVPAEPRNANAFAHQALAAGNRDNPILFPSLLTGTFPVRAASGARFVLVGMAHGGLAPNLLLPAARVTVGMLIVGIVCAVLTRSLMRPILALQHGARRLAHGDLQHRVTDAPPLAGRSDELGDLGRDFDSMADRLQSAQAAQNRLLADVSHELRSPLTRLSFAVALARRQSQNATSASPDAGNAPLDRIEREANRMNELIGQLLTLARWENDTAETLASRTDVDLTPLVRDIAEDANYEAAAIGKRCVVEVTEAIPSIPADGELLRRAIENVVRNAVRYTAEHSAVEIALRYEKSDHKIFVTVRDHGPGVPDDVLASLFRPFFRIADARDRVTGGTGLGLAIADRAIRAHGGEIWAENVGDGNGGLLVTMQLPVVG